MDGAFIGMNVFIYGIALAVILDNAVLVNFFIDNVPGNKNRGDFLQITIQQTQIGYDFFLHGIVTQPLMNNSFSEKSFNLFFRVR